MWIVICGEGGCVDCDNVEKKGVWIVIIMWRGRVCGFCLTVGRSESSRISIGKAINPQ